MKGQDDHALGTAVWWLGLAIATSLGSLFAIPYPFGLVAIAFIFLTVGYVIPMKIIDRDSSRICVTTTAVCNRHRDTNPYQ
jgi:hypothetical protein